jgi:hypothetical protein
MRVSATAFTPLGVILRLEEELEKGKNIVIVLFFVAVSKYVTRLSRLTPLP